jgi:hypothetical protein
VAKSQGKLVSAGPKACSRLRRCEVGKVLKVVGILLVVAVLLVGVMTANGWNPAPKRPRSQLAPQPTSLAVAFQSADQPTATVTPTTTPTVTVTVTPTGTQTPKADPKVDEPDPIDTLTSSGWTVTFYEGVTVQMRQWAEDLEPVVPGWSEFPNVDFPKYDFEAKDGLEYGMAESAYCQQDGRCDVNVPAMHYRLITGDYAIPGIGECSAGNGRDGCAIALFNVGEVTAMFRDGTVDYGFTVFGRYWNGNAMPVTIRALASNTAYNMLNVEGGVNRGSNCSNPDGCEVVEITANILSGNQLLMKAVTHVARP